MQPIFLNKVKLYVGYTEQKCQKNILFFFKNKTALHSLQKTLTGSDATCFTEYGSLLRLIPISRVEGNLTGFTLKKIFTRFIYFLFAKSSLFSCITIHLHIKNVSIYWKLGNTSFLPRYRENLNMGLPRQSSASSLWNKKSPVAYLLHLK